MKTCLDCIPCCTRQALDAARIAARDDETRFRIMRRLMEAGAKFPEDATAPAMGAVIHRIMRQESGVFDPYGEIKVHTGKEGQDAPI